MGLAASVLGAQAAGILESETSDPVRLTLAQRYLERRRDDAAGERRQALLLQSHSARANASFARVGTHWQVEVRLVRPDSRRGTGAVEGQTAGPIRELPPKADLKVNYEVIERELGPVPRWVLRISSEKWPDGISWEQMLAGSHWQENWIRPCQVGSGCSAWRRFSAEDAIATAGRLGFAYGIQAPIFLQGNPGLTEWTSEDFFGRPQGWKWPSGLPWPETLWNAQGESRLSEREGA
jgi:hypothetical protein